MTAKKQSFIIIFLLCLFAGFLLAKMDTQPHWNDTGITAALVLITAFIFGVIKPAYAWLWALLIGGLIFAFNVYFFYNYGAALVLAFSFAGAYAGIFVNTLAKKAN